MLPHGAWPHLDAVYDGTDAQTERAASAVLGDAGEVRLLVERDGLVAGVIADHVALATVDAHVFIDDGHHLLAVVQVVVGSDAWQRFTYYVLGWEGRNGRGEKEIGLEQTEVSGRKVSCNRREHVIRDVIMQALSRATYRAKKDIYKM